MPHVSLDSDASEAVYSPLYKKPVNRSLFGLLRERLKARRPKPTVKLSLEGLTERILPSASPVTQPPVAAMTPQMASAMDQLTHAIAIIQNDVSNVWKAITQEAAYVHEQWDHLLGITPAVPQPGSGSGSGSGAMTTAHNAQNQQLKIATPQAGSGSGSSATTTVHENTSAQRVKLLAGSGSGSGSNPPPDVYTWAPGSGSGGNPSIGKASKYYNWYLNGVPQGGPTGYVPGNKPTDEVDFNGDISNAPIEWNGNFTFSTMSIVYGYTGLQTIDPGVNKIELTGVDGDSLSMDGNGASNLTAKTPALAAGGVSDLNLQFNDWNQVFQIDKDATITNMDVTGDGQTNATDLLLISGGTTTIAAAPGFTENLGVQLMIGEDGTLSDQG